MRQAAKKVMIEARILLRALRDPRTPVVARIIAIAVVLYVLSPVDILPDYMPIVGLLDDIAVMALGMFAVLRLIPREVMTQYRPPPPANDNGSASPHGAMLPLLVALIVVLVLTLAAWFAYGVFAP